MSRSTLKAGTDLNRPVPGRLPSNLLDHVSPVEKADFGRRNQQGLWNSYNCLDTLVPYPTCANPLDDGEPEQPKQFASAPWIEGFQFAVYGAVQCAPVGLDKADQDREVKRVFGLNEGKGVERALRLNRFVAQLVEPTRPDSPGVWQAPVNLNTSLTGKALTIPQSIALLEGYAATIYAGIPTLHLPRAVLPVMASTGLLQMQGNQMFTPTGAKIAAGGGYDPDYTADAFDGTVQMWATGEVYVERSGRVEQSAYTVPGDGALERGDLSDNTYVSLVERMYRVGVDCFVAQVTGTLIP